MKNTGLVILGTLGVIVLGFIGPLISYLVGKDQLAPNEKAIITSMLNFELSLLIVYFVINFIPIIGQLLTLVLLVVNLVYAILSFVAAKDNKTFSALTIYPFVK